MCIQGLLLGCVALGGFPCQKREPTCLPCPAFDPEPATLTSSLNSETAFQCLLKQGLQDFRVHFRVFFWALKFPFQVLGVWGFEVWGLVVEASSQGLGCRGPTFRLRVDCFGLHVYILGSTRETPPKGTLPNPTSGSLKKGAC